MAPPLSRRRFLRGAGALGLAAWATPSLTRVVWASSPSDDPDHGTGFSSGVASFDPAPDSVILWTRLDEGWGSQVEVQLATDPEFASTSSWIPVPATGDRTFQLDPGGLLPGTTYWYHFRTPDGQKQSAPGRTRTAPTDPSQLRLAVTSCQDWQLGLYTAWDHIAGIGDLDAVVFLGDYIYEYGSYGVESPYSHGRTHVIRPHLDPRDMASLVPETIDLLDYRLRYRLYRSDPALRAAHRNHPWVVVWDDHEAAGDRWAGGAPNHGDNASAEVGGHYDAREDETSAAYVPYDERLANGVQAYREYLPGRYHEVDGSTTVFRHVGFGGLADLFMLDSRTFRSEGVGGSNRNFNPLNNRDLAGISDPERTLLGAAQKQWLKDGLAGSTAAWKLVGNQMLMSPLNLVNLPDVVGQLVAEATQDERAEPLPVTYHRDGIPVNTDQWDGYQPERRELLSFIRYGADAPATEAERQLADVVPSGNHVPDVVFLTGDIHIGWVNEVTMDWGDAPADEPVAAELVCPGISSENFNERIGDMAGGRGPLPHGTTRLAGPATLAMNRHVRYVDFDANGYTLVDIDPDRVQATQMVVANPVGTDPRQNPCANPSAVVVPADAGRWEVRSGSSRVVPSVG